MKSIWQRFVRDEQGITALETAIILIAFVVVASVFAFTILSSGTSSTQQAKDAIAGGLAQVSGSLEVRGSVIAEGTPGATPTVDKFIFTLATVTGGDPVDLTEPTDEDSKHTLVIDYRDGENHCPDIKWTQDFLGSADTDDMLENRELAQITILMSDVATACAGVELGPNSTFVLELKPPSGGTMPLERTLPPSIEEVMDLG